MTASHLQRWPIGDVRITAVLESATVFDGAFIRQYVLPQATREALAEIAWLRPHWVDDDGEPRLVTQAFLIESDGKKIVVDTCIGNDKERKNPAFHKLATPFLERLAEAGARVEDVDVVLCTHLHFDHVGWNTRWVVDADGAGRWVPTFPNARYLFARVEWEHWLAKATHGYVMADSLRPVMDAGLVDLVDVAADSASYPVTREVALEPTPGHTPGHVAVRIRSRGAEAAITGDLIHHPAQIARPEWTSAADTDKDLAAATRAAFLADAEARGVLVCGTHFAPPAAGRIRSRTFQVSEEGG